MITRIYGAKILVKHISCDCESKFNSSRCNLNQRWNNDKCQCECKKYHTCKKDHNWNPSTCICEKGKYLKSIADASVISCNEIISIPDNASTNVTSTVTTNMTDTVPTNVTRTVPINADDKKVRYKIDDYLLHMVLLVIIVLFIIVIICYDYAKHRSKQKRIGTLTK